MGKYYKKDYEKIGELVSCYKNPGGNSHENPTLNLIGLFNPLLYKYCRLGGKRDEDLYSELIIALIKCLKKFEIDKSKYDQMYEKYRRPEGVSENAGK
jgi:hypothetical protein